MKFSELIEVIQKMNGNYRRKADDLYILPSNIEKLPVLLNEYEDIQSILITPFLLNIRNNTLYELHYYEFEIEVGGAPKSCYLEHAESNVLPKEMVENIKPKALVCAWDKEFFANSLCSYLKSMKQMTFEQDKLAITALEDSNLYYKIY